MSRLGAIFRRRSEPSRHPVDSHVAGWVDGLSDGRLSGWAFSHLSPRRRLKIVVREGSAILACGVAELYRADVDRAFDVSDGYCGFSIPLPRKPGSSVRVEVADFAIEVAGALAPEPPATAEAARPH